MGILWKLPVPSTALLEDPTFVVLMDGSHCIRFRFEGENDEIVNATLSFEGVVALKVTYYRAVSAGQISAAYDKVVSVDSEWLKETVSILKGQDIDTRDMRHMLIVFDEGSCFEFICSAFKPLIGVAFD